MMEFATGENIMARVYLNREGARIFPRRGGEFNYDTYNSINRFATYNTFFYAS